MPLKKKKIKKGTLENELENQNALVEVLTKDKKEKEWKGVGKSLKQHKKIMDRYWGLIKKKEKKENPDKPMKVKELKVEKHKSWKEHNAWLDTFRAKIITGKGDK